MSYGSFFPVSMNIYDFYLLQILLTVAEHHSAIVPWQIIAQKTGAILKYVGLTKEEIPDLVQFKNVLSKKTKLVVVHHVSNTLGCFSQSHLVISNATV